MEEIPTSPAQAPKTVMLKIDGQEYPVDYAIANGGTTIPQSDQLLRDALRPTFEIAAGATFLREERDGQQVITLVKQPGPKGAFAEVLRRLCEAEEWVNPVVGLACELQLLEARNALTLPAILRYQTQIDDALKRGHREEKAISAALAVLRAAPAIVASDVPPGL